jgi:hypothetical protein
VFGVSGHGSILHRFFEHDPYAVLFLASMISVSWVPCDLFLSIWFLFNRLWFPSVTVGSCARGSYTRTEVVFLWVQPFKAFEWREGCPHPCSIFE